MAKTSSRERKAGALTPQTGNIGDFLGLSPAEVTLIEMQVELTLEIKRLRAELGLTQSELAARVGTSQPRIAQLEAGGPPPSLNFLVRCLGNLGMDRASIAGIMAR